MNRETHWDSLLVRSNPNDTSHEWIWVFYNLDLSWNLIEDVSTKNLKLHNELVGP